MSPTKNSWDQTGEEEKFLSNPVHVCIDLKDNRMTNTSAERAQPRQGQMNSLDKSRIPSEPVGITQHPATKGPLVSSHLWHHPNFPAVRIPFKIDPEMADWTGKIFRISQQKSSKIHVKSRFTAKIAKCGSFIMLTS